MTGTANNILTRPAATAHSVSGQRSAVSGQRSAVSGQRSAVSGQRSAVSGQRSAVSGQRSAVSGQRSAVSGQRSAVSGQRSAVSGQRSAVSGQRSGSKPTIHFPSLGAPMLASGSASRDGIAGNRLAAAIGSAAYRNTASIAASCARPASDSRSVSGLPFSLIRGFAELRGSELRAFTGNCTLGAKVPVCCGLGTHVVAPEHHDISLAGTSAGRDTNSSCAHTLLGVRREGELLLRHHPQP